LIATSIKYFHYCWLKIIIITFAAIKEYELITKITMPRKANLLFKIQMIKLFS